ncbi:hypothetical protein HK098_004658 [Nowakowskiella sp. JEL0407]|nr:hypothetical protein HK098_004658 [Nowakowskiella sp. JEL0407]
MTGLDFLKDEIIEIAVILSDHTLDKLAEGPNLVIRKDISVMNNMNDWCKTHHGNSGLTQRVLSSTVSTNQAESEILNFLQKHNVEKKQAILAGNSVHMDKMFLAREMPLLMDYLGYRIVDVSTIKELARRWSPEIAENAPKKAGGHRALDDIKESIEELRYYKKFMFKS